MINSYTETTKKMYTHFRKRKNLSFEVKPLPHSLDLTTADFYLWGSLNDVQYHRKPTTLAVLRQEMKNAT